ncbi:MAG TPA: hypothetical protein VK700_19155 [Steroidobacteraceae bacterium]|nr:hypothetical protein [Steroidobacteraceae bacterium]
MRISQRIARTTRVMAAATALLLASAVASAQTAAVNTPSSAPPASPSPDYHPSLGDLMTMAIQPRHTKLGLAGQQMNWPYALYELSELRNAFARVARTIPVYRNIDMTAVIGAMTTAPLSAVEKAIHAQDARQFNAAYAQLTTVCNACHLSQDHAPVVIRVPASNPYADQDFHRPVR